MLKKLLHIFLFVFFLAAPLFAEMTIKITEPLDGAVTWPCQTIPLKAEVTATTETIKYVYFYVNGVSRGRATEAPWEYTKWSEVSSGNYVIGARVVDADKNEVWAEPVKIKVGPLSNGDKIINGDFSCGKLAGWTLNIYNEGNGAVTVMDDGYFDDAYYIYYESESASTDWYVQFSQTVPVDSGHIYDIYFLADSNEPRSISVGFQEPREPYRTHVWQTVDIDGADEYRIEGGMAQFTDAANVFKFNLGGSDIPFYLDNVRVIDRSMAFIKSKEFSFDGVGREFELYQAYPNPFNMSTMIRFNLSQPSEVNLDVYNMQGQKVKTLVAETRTAGSHVVQWNGTNDQNEIVPSGVYVYRLTSSSAHVNLSRKILLLK